MGCCNPKPTSAGKSQGKSHKASKSFEKRSYVALWNYTALTYIEIDLSAGDIVQQRRKKSRNIGNEWLFVVPLGKSSRGGGYVPVCVLAAVGTVEVERWYFGTTSRKEAEILLKDQSDGTFLVRKSCSGATSYCKEVYALSVAYERSTRHYRIVEVVAGGNAQFIFGSRSFRTLRGLVSHFQSDATTPEQGICCQLKQPPVKIKPELPVMSVNKERRCDEINRDQLNVTSEIGGGFFGVVYRAHWKCSDGKQLAVAVKELKHGLIATRDKFLDEALIMRNLCHNNLLKLHGVVSTNEPVWIVTEYLRDGSLKMFLKRHARTRRYLPEDTLIGIASQIASGMYYLEKKRIIHRDLAARNILVEMNKSTSLRGSPIIIAKISDFGMARFAEDAIVETDALTLAVKWTAPEALQIGYFSVHSDVWSFGVLLHEIFTHGADPYIGMSMEDVRSYVVDKKRCLPRSNDLPDRIYQLLERCQANTPIVRPRFGYIESFLRCYYVEDGNPEYETAF